MLWKLKTKKYQIPCLSLSKGAIFFEKLTFSELRHYCSSDTPEREKWHLYYNTHYTPRLTPITKWKFNWKKEGLFHELFEVRFCLKSHRYDSAHLVPGVPGHRQRDFTLLPGNDVLSETTKGEWCEAIVNDHDTEYKKTKCRYTTKQILSTCGKNLKEFHFSSSLSTM